MTSATLLPNDQSKVWSQAWLKAQKKLQQKMFTSRFNMEAQKMPCISSHQIRSLVPGFQIQHSATVMDCLLDLTSIWGIISPCFEPLSQRCVTMVKVLLYTLDANAAEGSCSSTVTVPDISVEAWVAHLPEPTLRNNRDSSGETNQKPTSNPSKEHAWYLCDVPGFFSRFKLKLRVLYPRNPSKIPGFVSLPHSNLLR